MARIAQERKDVSIKEFKIYDYFEDTLALAILDYFKKTPDLLLEFISEDTENLIECFETPMLKIFVESLWHEQLEDSN